MAVKPKPSGSIVRLKVSLTGSKPPIWRRLLIPEDFNLHELHVAIQCAMDWDGGHMHAFAIAGEQYGDPDTMEDDDTDVKDESDLTLAEVQRLGVKKFRYIYDFGDDWDHAILLEGSEPPVAGRKYPHCLTGKRAAPPEDCGGVPGYEQLLDILADPSHPARAQRLEWMGIEAFDPEEFSAEDVNSVLGGAFGEEK